MTKLLEEIHPGEILLEDFMKPMGISARQLAADIDVSPSRISEPKLQVPTSAMPMPNKVLPRRIENQASAPGT